MRSETCYLWKLAQKTHMSSFATIELRVCHAARTLGGSAAQKTVLFATPQRRHMLPVNKQARWLRRLSCLVALQREKGSSQSANRGWRGKQFSLQDQTQSGHIQVSIWHGSQLRRRALIVQATWLSRPSCLGGRGCSAKRAPRTARTAAGAASSSAAMTRHSRGTVKCPFGTARS